MKHYTNDELDALSYDEIRELMAVVLNEREECKDPFSVEALRLDDFYSVLDGKLGQLEYESMVSLQSEFGKPTGPGENDLWHIVHECDDDNDKPQEWATKLPNGNYIWIDIEEDNMFGVHLYADPDISPEKTFRSLSAAQKYVDENYRNHEENTELQIQFRKRGGHR
jgi:hypothetical protein